MGLNLKDFDVEPLRCPACGKEQDGALATTAHSDAPSEGSVGICMDCGDIAVYTVVNGKLALRGPSEDELLDMLRDPHIQKCIAAVRIVREGR